MGEGDSCRAGLKGGVGWGQTGASMGLEGGWRGGGEEDKRLHSQGEEVKRVGVVGVGGGGWGRDGIEAGRAGFA